MSCVTYHMCHICSGAGAGVCGVGEGSSVDVGDAVSSWCDCGGRYKCGYMCRCESGCLL